MLLNKTAMTSFLGAMLCSFSAYSGPPVFPDAAGFGIDTPGGRGGTVIRVTNLSDSGSGSLRECLEAAGPRICVFEVGGVIRLTRDLKIWNPRVTIAGQTAPEPGIMLRGAGLGIHASDVVVQHIAIRPGDALDGPDPGNRDALMIDSGNSEGVRNIVIDHCSFTWSIDELLSTANNWGDVTIMNSIIAAPLHDSLHPEGSHGFGPLLNTATGGGSGRVLLFGNLIAHTAWRSPLTRAQEFVFVNNVVYNHQEHATDLANVKVSTRNAIVGNVYIRGPNTRSSSAAIRIVGESEWASVPKGTVVYLSDNRGVQPNGSQMTSDQWSLVRNDSGLPRRELEVSQPPVWPEGLVAMRTDNDAVLDYVLENAGTRPARRNAVDAAIVAQVQNKTSGFINCVERDSSSRCARNGGGWPAYGGTHWTLEVPADPNAYDAESAYTNIEIMLQEMAAAVQGGGRTAEPKPKPPRLVAGSPES